MRNLKLKLFLKSIHDSCIVLYNKGNFWRNYMYWYDNLRHSEKLIFWILWNKRLKIGLPLPECVPRVE
jgi:hypothetical protein